MATILRQTLILCPSPRNVDVNKPFIASGGGLTFLVTCTCQPASNWDSLAFSIDCFSEKSNFFSLTGSLTMKGVESETVR